MELLKFIIIVLTISPILLTFLIGLLYVIATLLDLWNEYKQGKGNAS